MERVYTRSVSSITTSVYTRLLYVVCTILAMSYISTSQAELLHHDSYETIDTRNTSLDSEYKHETDRINNSTLRNYSTNICLTDICMETDLINGKTKSDVKARAVKKVLDFYNSCMNEAEINMNGRAELISTLNSLGDNMFPMTSIHFDEHTADTFDLSFHLRTFNIHTFFNQFVRLDKEQPAVYRLHIDQVFINLGIKENYRNNAFLKRYEDFIVGTVGLIKGIESTARQDAKDIINFEKKLSEARSDHVYDINIRTYKKYTLKTLKTQVTDRIPWDEYFNKQLKQMGKPLVNDSTIIISYAPDNYFKILVNLLEKTSKRTLANYQMFTMIYNIVGYLGPDFRYFIKKLFSYPLINKPRNKECEDVVSKFMNYAVTRMYVEKYLHRTEMSEVTSMMKDIKANLKQRFLISKWMQLKTIMYAREKLDSTKDQIGYPDYIMDDAKLDSLYVRANITKGSYIVNVFDSWKNKYYINFKKLNTEHNDELWGSDGILGDAKFMAKQNTVRVSPSWFTDPLYHKDYPKYLNYAGIGFIYGHLITHGFDYTGRQIGQNGKRRNWWTPYTLDNFKQVSKCHVEQYNKLYIHEVSKYINGRKTLIENIADNGGLQISFKAYREYVSTTLKGVEEKLLPDLKMSANQLFFLHKAQTMCTKIYDKEVWNVLLNWQRCPDRYRILGMMANSYDFAMAYECPVGSRMNPPIKCNIW